MTAPTGVIADLPGLRLELLEVVGCGIWIYDGVDTRYVNHELSLITGYTVDELLAPHFFATLIHPEDREMIVERGRARVRGEAVPEVYEIRVIARGGEVRTLALTARRMTLASGAVSVVSAVDVTQLRQAEEVIRTGSNTVVGLLHSLPAHVITTDPEGKPTFVNQHWLELTGQTEEEALSKGTAPLIHPDDTGPATARWRDALRTGEGYEIDYRVRDAHGEYRWQNFRIRPLLGAEGERIGWTSASVDVHDAKVLADRLNTLNEELIAAIEAKDEVLGLISHELRTPLTTLLGNARLLRRHGETLSTEDRLTVAADLETDAARLDAVIANMLILSRLNVGETVESEPLRVPTLTHEVVHDFETRQGGRKIQVICPEDLPLGLGNATHFRQVLGNLLSNAHKYSPPGCPILVELRKQDGAIEISVTDQGQGLTDEDRSRIFDAFFRSPAHSSVYGIGLGLTVCRRLVELHGGSISARNVEPHGSAFSFTTPEFPEDSIPREV